jgi:hypothetical protein
MTKRERRRLKFARMRLDLVIYRSTVLANIAALQKRIFHYAINTAFQTSLGRLFQTRGSPGLNWPLWIRRSSSIPAIVTAGPGNDSARGPS